MGNEMTRQTISLPFRLVADFRREATLRKMAFKDLVAEGMRNLLADTDRGRRERTIGHGYKEVDEVTLESWESELDDVREKFAALRAGGHIAVDSAVKMDALIAFMVANPPSSEAFKAETSTGDC